MLTVGVVKILPVDTILGADFVVLLDLLFELEQELPEETDCGENGEYSVTVSCLVITRAQVKAGVQPFPDLDHNLCEGGTKGPRKLSR